jgi:hemoglobin-like flavoprotein
MIFYQAFFKRNVDAKRLFENDLSLQSTMFTSMITKSAKLLLRFEQLYERMICLGERHRLYNVSRDSFNGISDAIKEMLQTILGEDCNDDICRSWETVIELESAIMLIEIDPGAVTKFVSVKGLPNRWNSYDSQRSSSVQNMSPYWFKRKFTAADSFKNSNSKLRARHKKLFAVVLIVILGLILLVYLTTIY